MTNLVRRPLMKAHCLQEHMAVALEKLQRRPSLQFFRRSRSDCLDGARSGSPEKPAGFSLGMVSSLAHVAHRIRLPGAPILLEAQGACRDPRLKPQH